MAETNDDRQELVEAFEEWFTELLLRDGSSCLERDVLRNQKKNLKAEWLKIRPVHTSSGETEPLEPLEPIEVHRLARDHAECLEHIQKQGATYTFADGAMWAYKEF